MDVGLPDTDGREVVRCLRKGGFKAPIIMLTGHDTDLGHHSRAWNPAPMTTWQSRSALPCCWLASAPSSASMRPARTRCSRSAPTSFRPGSKMLTGANARKVRLTEKETAILRFLYRAGQKPVSRETLLQEVWGYNSGVDHPYPGNPHLPPAARRSKRMPPIRRSW